MILEVRHLNAVDAIAREGTMTAAAERLHLTQPAISHAIRELETRLGVKLFRRTRKRMELTPEGLRVLRAGEVVLDEIRRAEEDILSFRDGRSGILRIATECFMCYHWVPKAIPLLAESFPEVTLQIVPEATADPLAALLAERIDLALVHGSHSHLEIAFDELFTDEFVAIVPPGSPLATRAWLNPTDFADEHLFLHSHLERSLLLKRFLAPAEVRPRQVSQLGISEAIFEAVKAGLGVSAAPSWMVADPVREGSLAAVRIGRNGLRRPWKAARLRRRQEGPALRELIRLLRLQEADLTAPVDLLSALG